MDVVVLDPWRGEKERLKRKRESRDEDEKVNVLSRRRFEGTSVGVGPARADDERCTVPPFISRSRRTAARGD